MAQDAIKKCLGWISQYNPLSTLPGALLRANDCYIRRENIIEDRRGHNLYGTLATQPKQLLSYSNTVLSHRGTAVSFDNGSGTFTDYSGTYNAPTGQKMRSVEQFSNLYATTDQGVKVFTDVVGTVARSAGMPRALDPSYALDSGASGFLANGSQCAYRVCLQRTDANSNSIRSYPSTRLWVTNPGITTTGTITNASTSMTSVGSTAGLVVGQLITGSGIAAGTTVSSISGSTVTMSQIATISTSPTGTTVTGSNQLTSLTSVIGITAGLTITGTGIPAGTTVTGVGTTSITISQNATASASSITFTIGFSGVGLSFAFGTSRNVDITEFLPAEASTGDVVEIYRTAQQVGTSTDLSGDEMALVYQVALLSTDISAGFITFVDSVTDTLRGASLYTSPSQEGISQANDRPPVCKDMGFFKSAYMLYANTQTKQRLFFTMVGTSSLTGNTLTLGGITYNFGSTEIISGGGAPQVKVGSTGVVSVDIDTTARSLVKVINRYASNTSIYAFYQSTPDSLPGQILIEERGIGASAYTAQASNTALAGMFFPAPPVSPATSTKSTSSNQVQKNALYYSKAQQGEHVPTLNYLLIGAANKEILRIAPLRDSTIIIKEEGVFRLSGETPQSFTVVPVDLTVFCKAVDSVAILGNQVYMLSNQGVVSISESGVQVISRDIEQMVAPLLTFSNIGSNSTGFAYESERSYFLSTLTNSNDTVQNQTLVYNYFTKAWVRHTYALVASIVGSDDKMYFAKPNDVSIYKERKSFTDADNADPDISITIVSVVNSVVSVTTGGLTPQVGWTITQNGTSIPISAVSIVTGSFSCTMQSTPSASWVPGAAVMSPSVGMDIQWHSWTADHPDYLKQVRQIGILADNEVSFNSVTSLVATFSSNFDNGTEEVTITTPGGGWGAAWGSSPWGGTSDTAGYPTYVPRNKQYCTRLTLGVRHPNALERIAIAGACFSFENTSERIGR